jgi:AcrR family transcriptional regulator
MLTDLLPGVLGELGSLDPADDAVLDAALAQAAAVGLKRTTMDDIARRAGVGRMTVYRRFTSKDALLRRLVLREALRVVDAVRAASAADDDLADRIVTAFVTVLRFTREHPLVERIVRFEPETLLELASLREPDIVALSRAFVAGELRRAGVDVDHEQVAEAVVRLVVSFVVVPRSVVDVTDDAEARAFARAVLVPMLTGGRS